MVTVTVRFRAQGNTEWQPGKAIARRGSKLLIAYRIKSGASRERWIAPDRYEVLEGEVAALPVEQAVKHARAFKVTLPDGRVRRMNGLADQDRPAGTHYGFATRTVLTDGGAGAAWHLAGGLFATRAEAEAAHAARRAETLAYLREKGSSARADELEACGPAAVELFANGYSERAVVEIIEQ